MIAPIPCRWRGDATPARCGLRRRTLDFCCQSAHLTPDPTRLPREQRANMAQAAGTAIPNFT
ncbi:hypothetical protein KVU_2419 [Ketogulonicigenium vulgare WSH-001]|uniref:Uncharacterized protein n=1 Tax=Ketogulonicigenium vulgare (strain WSH-001) TaxID=759362 RepID=F9Y768_KETVW|nr:hypothetical protein KVU_2419 [Ketogulonicigenium vulgare WSH-001]